MSGNLDAIKKILIKAIHSEMKNLGGGIKGAQEFEDVRHVESFLQEHDLTDDTNNQLVMLIEQVGDEHQGYHNNVFYVNLAEFSEAKRDHLHPGYWAMGYISHILEAAMAWEPVYGTAKKNSFSDSPEVAKQMCTRIDIENTIPSRVLVYEVY